MGQLAPFSGDSALQQCACRACQHAPDREGGLEAHFAKYQHASRTVRRELGKMGLEMYVPDEYASPIVTGVRARPSSRLLS
jgi:aspartate aminotransferase-like enzyme